MSRPADASGPPDTARRRLRRWSLLLAISLLVGIGLILIFLLVQATNNRLLYERYYARLFVVNVVVAAVLVQSLRLALVGLIAHPLRPWQVSSCDRYGRPVLEVDHDAG